MQNNYKHLLLIPIILVAILIIVVCGPRNNTKEYFVGGAACSGTVHGNFHIAPCNGSSQGYSLRPGPSIKKKVFFLGAVEAVCVVAYIYLLSKKPVHPKHEHH
jgi:hypothetical protein